MAKRQADSYVTAFLEMLGDPRPYVTLGSCKNQFYSDLIPAMCRLDYTKAGGGPYCDCGYHKKGFENPGDCHTGARTGWQ